MKMRSLQELRYRCLFVGALTLHSVGCGDSGQGTSDNGTLGGGGAGSPVNVMRSGGALNNGGSPGGSGATSGTSAGGVSNGGTPNTATGGVVGSSGRPSAASGGASGAGYSTGGASGAATAGAPNDGGPQSSCSSSLSGAACATDASCNWIDPGGCSGGNCRCISGTWACATSKFSCGACPTPQNAQCGGACAVTAQGCLCQCGGGPNFAGCSCTAGSWQCLGC
jgi:endoglucanase